MEEEKDETIDSTNDTEDTEKVDEDESAKDDSEETEEEDKPKYTDNEKKLYARAKKAEAEVKLAKEELAKKSKFSEKPAPAGDIDKLLDAKLEKRDLDALDLSDELKKEVSTYAKVQGISVKKALNSEYISFLKEKDEKKQRIDDASLGSKRKQIKKDYSEMKPSDFDLKSPEGKAEFAKYEEHLRRQLG